jgi:hypothetical protein
MQTKPQRRCKAVRMNTINVFILIPGRTIWEDKTGCPWQVFQFFLPKIAKQDFLFGSN